ncbi:MAG: PKD domain-containing protein, partial [Deltaproteobacteria bacterium]
DDHGFGSRIVPHEIEPDTTPPRVNMVHPPPDAANQPVTTRIGLTFTDRIDLRSVNAETLILQTLDGERIPGRYSGQTGIVNFAPLQPLEAETTYEIVVPAGGIRDYAGNPIQESFSSIFSTGSTIETITCEFPENAPAFVGGEVTFEVLACNEESLTFSWDFGDGSEPTQPDPRPSATHRYEGPGHFLVVVTVSDGEISRTFSVRQTVVHPPTQVQPTQSATIVHEPDFDRVWVVNPDSNTVTAIDAETLEVRFERRVGKHPRTLAPSPRGEIWVVNQGEATIAVLDAREGRIVRHIPLPRASRPYGIAFSPVSEIAFVTLEGVGRLLALDARSGEIIADVEVGPRPRGIAVTHDGARIFVTRFLSPSDRGEILEIDAETFTVTRTIELAQDPGPDTESSGRGIPNYLSSITISPDGRRAWVPSKKDNTLRGLYRDGLPLTFESTVRTIVSQIDLVENRE